jgi:hypothetical protein
MKNTERKDEDINRLAAIQARILRVHKISVSDADIHGGCTITGWDRALRREERFKLSATELDEYISWTELTLKAERFDVRLVLDAARPHGVVTDIAGALEVHDTVADAIAYIDGIEDFDPFPFELQRRVKMT